MKDGRRYNNCCPFHHISIQKARLAGKRKKTFGSLTEKKHLDHWLKITFGSLAKKTFASLAEKNIWIIGWKTFGSSAEKTFGSSAEKNICIIGWKKHSAPQWPEITSALVVLFATFLCWLLCFIRITQLEKKNNTVCAIFKEIFWAHICANILSKYLCKYFEQIFVQNFWEISSHCAQTIYILAKHTIEYTKKDKETNQQKNKEIKFKKIAKSCITAEAWG